MAQPKNPELLSENQYLMTQVPAGLDATVYDITIRYVFSNQINPEDALLNWAQAASSVAAWQGRILDITPVDNNTLPASGEGWNNFSPFVSPLVMSVGKPVTPPPSNVPGSIPQSVPPLKF